MNTCQELVRSREYLVTTKGILPGAYAIVRIDRVMGRIIGTAKLDGFSKINSIVDTPIPSNKNLTDVIRDIYQFLTDSIINQMQEFETETARVESGK